MDFELTPLQQDLQERTKQYAEEVRPHAAEWDINNKVPIAELTKRAGELDLLAITMPKEHGGQDLSMMEYTVVIETALRYSQCALASEPMFRTSGAGPSILLMSDNDVPRKKFMPAMIRGEQGCALALSEPKHGSDLTYLETRAVKEGDDYVLNGSKRFITGATEDRLYATFVRLSDTPGAKGIGAVMVEEGTPGFRIEKGPDFVASRGIPHGDLWFEDCRVPAENLLVAEGQFPRLMTAFNVERLHNGACSLGLAEAAFDEASRYAQERHQFGRPVIEFQAIYHMLAEMWVNIEATRMLIFRSAATANDGKYPQAQDVTIAKLFANETLYTVSKAAVQICAGDGLTLTHPVQRIARDAAICMVAGGTPQILKNVIAGMLFPGRKFKQIRDS
jgi:butyryl-CoA dehydrogenase